MIEVDMSPEQCRMACAGLNLEQGTWLALNWRRMAREDKLEPR